MKSLSLRAQVIIIVTILGFGLVGAIVYITGAIGSAKESIVRLNRARLASVTDNLARRYGLVLNFIASSQIVDSSLAHREELNRLLSGITNEELTKAPEIQAGFYHSLWNKEFTFTNAPRSKPGEAAYLRFLRVLLQSAVEEEREQWSQHESGGHIIVIVVKPVYARGRLVGAAWTVEDLENEFARSWPADVTPILQVAAVVGILLASFFLINLRRNVSAIQHGLEEMKKDITKRLQTSPSELGFISSSINGFAETIMKEQRERERLRNAIQQQEKLASLGQLVAGVAHEIRTPLTAIKTRVQLWQRLAKGQKRAGAPKGLAPDSMNMVVEELDRIERLVRQLLFFSKERKLSTRRVDLHELLNSCLRTLDERITMQKIRVMMHYGLENPQIMADESGIRQVILNLLANAVEAMPRGGKVLIETLNRAETVSVAVEDSGKGIAEEVAGKMFDPFFTTKETGTGLGLSIAYEIVRLHRGTIDYASGKNGGSRFTVSLPREGKELHV